MIEFAHRGESGDYPELLLEISSTYYRGNKQ